MVSVPNPVIASRFWANILVKQLLKRENCQIRDVNCKIVLEIIGLTETVIWDVFREIIRDYINCQTLIAGYLTFKSGIYIS